MHHARQPRFLALGGLLLGAAAAVSVGREGPASPAGAPPPPPLYHPDPQHLWNRLHAALFDRTGPDGRVYGHDRIEPLLWVETMHLLEPQSCDRAVRLLDEFVERHAERLIEDPVKRAVLQRDLWLVFNWVEGPHDKFEDTHLGDSQVWRTSRARLRRRLAAVIGRVALAPNQVRRLPDNYAAAAASGRFAPRYDPAQPDRPYLPPDLFAADGPWVCVGRPDGPVAREHLRDDGGNLFTNSVFLVFVRLPAGRAATVAYLKKLRSFDRPLLVRAQDAGKRLQKFLPNPELPQFPVGTQVALVRRALLIASDHTPVASPLTESVQLRVYREIPAMTAETLDAALGGGTAANRQAHAWQSFQEFRLSRADLFAGRAGGLRPVAAGERDFDTGFGGVYAYDALEVGSSGQPFTGPRSLIMEGCFACHSFPGAYSFNCFFNFRISDLQDGNAGRPAALAEMSPSEALGTAARWKQGRPGWAALRGLLPE
jgi:hypothetical protein